MLYPKIPYSGNPVVSIIITCQNNIDKISRSIQGVFNQGINDFEIIIINNFLTNETWNWLVKQSKAEKRIRLFRTSVNTPEQLRDFSIKQCRGKYIAFLDTKNEWRPMKLWKQYEYLKKNNNVIMCFSNYAYTYYLENTSITYLDLFPSSCLHKKSSTEHSILEDIENINLSNNTINISTVLVNKSSLLDAISIINKTNNRNNEDLWHCIFDLGNIAYSKIPEVQYTLKNNLNARKTYIKLMKLNYILNKYSISTNNNNLIFIKYKTISNNENDKYLVKADTLFSNLTHRLRTYT